MDAVSTISYLQKVKDQKKELTFPCLIDFGSCNLHSVHEPFDVGIKYTG